MDKEIWASVEALFHQAMDQPSDDRLEFVLGSSGSPPEVREEVLSLLRNLDSKSDFLERSKTPNWSGALGKLSNGMRQPKANPDRQTASQINEKLSRIIEETRPDLKVTRTISRGGMGTVFEVMQTSLGRPVAVKILTNMAADDKVLPPLHRRVAGDGESDPRQCDLHL